MSAPSAVVLGLGNPLLDISAEVPHEFVEKYGLKMNNAILAEEKHMQIYDDMEKHYKVQYINGGACQNAIRICQGLFGTGEDKYKCAFIGCLGTDEHATVMRSNLEAEGVLGVYATSEKNPSGTCAVLVHDNERSLVANVAAAGDFPLDHLRFKAWEHVEAAKICYVEGFFITTNHAAMMCLAEHCAKSNKVFTLNLSAPFLCEFFKDQMDALMPYTDFIFGNESEAETFAKAHGWDTADIDEIAHRMAQLPKVNQQRRRVVVITQGHKYTCIATTWRGAGVKVTRFPVEPLEKSKIVDTNGAGDSFVGGFLYGLAKGLDTDGSVFFAHYAARHKLQRAGCTYDFKDKPADHETAANGAH